MTDYIRHNHDDRTRLALGEDIKMIAVIGPNADL
jgi:hypothetical protein